jgi:hypothetical protein
MFVMEMLNFSNPRIGKSVILASNGRYNVERESGSTKK